MKSRFQLAATSQPLAISPLDNSCRINTSKSVSKQRTLTPFRMNTYGKHRGEGVLWLTSTLSDGIGFGSLGAFLAKGHRPLFSYCYGLCSQLPSFDTLTKTTRGWGEAKANPRRNPCVFRRLRLRSSPTPTSNIEPRTSSSHPICRLHPPCSLRENRVPLLIEG
jgi:hypothetical protein